MDQTNLSNISSCGQVVKVLCVGVWKQEVESSNPVSDIFYFNLIQIFFTPEQHSNIYIALYKHYIT